MNMKKQQGVALVVGLVMLLVLTIMGISSMNNTTLQLQIAKNTQEQNVAFQTSLACIDYAIRNADLSTQVKQPFNYTMPNSTLNATCTTEYVGCTRIFGGSLERAGSQNVFETESTGFSAGAISRSTVVSAVGKPTPAGCPTK